MRIGGAGRRHVAAVSDAGERKRRPVKDASNQKKHGLSFEEAGALFASDDYLEIFDDNHSETEDRFISIGLIGRGLIVVVWTPSEEDTAHIISARFATTREEAL